MGTGAWSWAVAAGAAAAMALVAAGRRNSSSSPWVGALTMTAILLSCCRWRFRSNRPKGSPKTEDDTPDKAGEVWMPLDEPSGENMSLYMPQTAEVMGFSSDLSIVSADDYLVSSPHNELNIPAVGAQDDTSVMEGQPADAQRSMEYDKYLLHPKLTSASRLQVLRAKASVQKFYQTDE